MLDGASVTDAAHDDATARIVLAFDGSESDLSQRNRMLFDLARMLTGEAPPYATLMYVWDGKAPVGTEVISTRSDRMRKIVVASGGGSVGQLAALRARRGGRLHTPVRRSAGCLDRHGGDDRCRQYQGPRRSLLRAHPPDESSRVELPDGLTLP